MHLIAVLPFFLLNCCLLGSAPLFILFMVRFISIISLYVPLPVICRANRLVFLPPIVSYFSSQCHQLVCD